MFAGVTVLLFLTLQVSHVKEMYPLKYDFSESALTVHVNSTPFM